MDNRHNDSMKMQSQNAATLSSRSVTYGIASGMDMTEMASVGTDSLTFSEQLNYLFSEYFKGLFFVILSSAFIFAMPKVLTRQGSWGRFLTDSIKRIMDVTGAVVGLILTLPVWLIVPILIKLDSPGPVFYTQTRVGVNRRKGDRRFYQKADISDRRSRGRRRMDLLGKPFNVYKFRTMVVDAEKASGPVWAAKNDPRITRLGAFLRKSRIDEIPQFWNILVGEMSLVGPRPERPNFVRDLSGKVDGYSGRLLVKPGLTGLAQVENGYDSSLSSVIRKVKYDLDYIENRSIWFDIKIILKTIIVVFTGKGAH